MRRAAMFALPTVACLIGVALWQSSCTQRVDVFRVLYSEDFGQWGTIIQEDGRRFLLIGSSQERLPWDGENYVVGLADRFPYARLRPLIADDDFPVVVRLDASQEPGTIYRARDGAVLWNQHAPATNSSE